MQGEYKRASATVPRNPKCRTHVLFLHCVSAVAAAAAKTASKSLRTEVDGQVVRQNIVKIRDDSSIFYYLPYPF